MGTTVRPPGAPHAHARLRLILIARHALVRRGIENALGNDPGIDLVGTATSLRSAVVIVRTAGTDVVLIDSSSWDDDAPVQIERMREASPELAIVLLTARGSGGTLPSNGKGIRVLSRMVEPTALGSAIRDIVFDRPGSPSLIDALHPVGPRLLTDREYDVLGGLSRGLTNKAIARELWLSEHTVKFHVSAIYRKLGVRSRAEAARWHEENTGDAWGESQEPRPFRRRG